MSSISEALMGGTLRRPALVWSGGGVSSSARRTVGFLGESLSAVSQAAAAAPSSPWR